MCRFKRSGYGREGAVTRDVAGACPPWPAGRAEGQRTGGLVNSTCCFCRPWQTRQDMQITICHVLKLFCMPVQAEQGRAASMKQAPAT